MNGSSSTRTFDAVLCDLDGVVRHWDAQPMEALDRAWGLPEGTLARAAFRPERLEPAVTGAVSDERFRALVAEDLAEVCGSPDRARELVEAWSRPVGRVDAEVLGLLAAARRKVPVVLVSNATTRLERDLAALGLDDAFDAVVNTARIGWCKPDPRVLGFAAELAGVHARRCLFVDDTLAHVEAARGLGMPAVHFTDADQLRAVLRGLGSGV
ncbi:HAD family hydrolase [Streptacidiphilus pinicola]|uniref:HAD family hydrolase n=1 Tax=Streptacidiphilus pinicola TaxID=2219663 RepID=A0A2X0K4T9_9ACTN|nr:HAD-IA family hydrolase [Streptacidiphilus pinicola]RAG82579.1 HAD family hydrolase [Streptacidiphilus pinicola]